MCYLLACRAFGRFSKITPLWLLQGGERYNQLHVLLDETDQYNRISTELMLLVGQHDFSLPPMALRCLNCRHAEKFPGVEVLCPVIG